MSTLWGEKFRAVGQDSLSTGKRPELPAEIITFKQLTRGSGFGRTIHCPPGRITVVQDTQTTRAESFRQALLGKGDGTMVSIRFGPDELRRSEMYVVGANDFIWESKTVYDGLAIAGVPEHRITALLGLISLEERAFQSPKNLDPLELKQLSLIESLFAKSKMLVYDRPFAGLPEQTRENISELMLDIFIGNERFVLVLGENELPRAWRNHESVLWVTPEQKLENLGLGEAVEETNRIAGLVHTLSAANHQPTTQTASFGRAGTRNRPTSLIITRPQMIFPPNRGKPAEVVQSEVINNPNMPDEIRQAQAAIKPRPTSKVLQAPLGPLTKVEKTQSSQARTLIGVLAIFAASIMLVHILRILFYTIQ